MNDLPKVQKNNHFRSFLIDFCEVWRLLRKLLWEVTGWQSLANSVFTSSLPPSLSFLLPSSSSFREGFLNPAFLEGQGGQFTPEVGILIRLFLKNIDVSFKSAFYTFAFFFPPNLTKMNIYCFCNKEWEALYISGQERVISNLKEWTSHCKNFLHLCWLVGGWFPNKISSFTLFTCMWALVTECSGLHWDL